MPSVDSTVSTDPRSTTAATWLLPDRETVIEATKDIIAGTIGGFTTVIVGHPLDTIKVRLQASTQYKSFADVLVDTRKKEGLIGLYKGVQSPLLGEGFFNAVQFLAWGLSKQLVSSSSTSTSTSKDLSVAQYFAAGAITGFASSFVEAPIDLLKSQLQVQIFRSHPQFTTFSSCVSSIYKENGMMGMYQGLSSTFLRTVPASACYFGVYEYVRSLFLSSENGHDRNALGAGAVLLAGGCGGCAYWGLSFPCDSIKSAIQGDSYKKAERKYTGLVDCTRKLYAEGGIKRFYRGLAPCMIRAFPANAACFYAYEKSRALMCGW